MKIFRFSGKLWKVLAARCLLSVYGWWRSLLGGGHWAVGWVVTGFELCGSYSDFQ